MRLLVIGGTRFIGRTIVDVAQARGWNVTTFNRGTTSTDVDGVEVVRGDRTNEGDLRRLVAGREWDAVVDLCGYTPRNVLVGAQMLEQAAARYLFVSTVSVYRDWPVSPLSEHSELLDCPPDADADYGPPDVEDGPTRYGRLKAGCEAAVLDVFGEARTTVLRLGVVLGPGEYVGRLPWWLSRIARGGPVVGPGDPARPIQPIDVRDVAEFAIQMLDEQRAGVFNVAATIGRATFGDLLAACGQVTDSDAEIVWVPDDRLLAVGIRQWSELPMWRTHAGVWHVDTSAGRGAGLTCRPLRDTVADTWAWMSATGGMAATDRSVEIGLTPEREQLALSSAR